VTVYAPLPLSEAWNLAIAQQTTPQIVLRDFLDDWRRVTDTTTRQQIVRPSIEDSSEPELHRWACFLATTVEYLTVCSDLPTPSWVLWECWALAEPWLLISHWKLRAWLLVATPPPFKRRRIFGRDEIMLIGRKRFLERGCGNFDVLYNFLE